MRATLAATALAGTLALGAAAAPALADDTLDLRQDEDSSVDRSLDVTGPQAEGDPVRTAGDAPESAANDGDAQNAGMTNGDTASDRPDQGGQQAEQPQAPESGGDSAQSRDGQGARDSAGSAQRQAQDNGAPEAGESPDRGAGSGEANDVSEETMQQVTEDAKEEAGKAGGGKEDTEKGDGKPQKAKDAESDENGLDEAARKSIDDHAQAYFARMRERGVPVGEY